MLKLYNDISFDLSRKLTNAYSTSFSLGIKAFAPEFRDPIYAIYGFVRVADEIVDTFHGYDKQALLNKFRDDAFEAIEMKISTNPILHSFQKTVHEYGIEPELINAFLKSMEMDLSANSYERKSYDEYIYGSAEVVGLMCLRVFCKNDNNLYEKLLFPARRLGAAFQKVNFLRDIKSDIDERGRIYLPGVHSDDYISDAEKKKLETEVNQEFDDALEGIKQLPSGVKLGVYSAFMYYYALFKKIERTGIKKLLKRRVRISNFNKLLLLLKSVIEIKVFKVT